MAERPQRIQVHRYDARLALVVPPTLKEWLEDESRNQGLSMSAYIRVLLVRAKREAAADE